MENAGINTIVNIAELIINNRLLNLNTCFRNLFCETINYY